MQTPQAKFANHVAQTASLAITQARIVPVVLYRLYYKQALALPNALIVPGKLSQIKRQIPVILVIQVVKLASPMQQLAQVVLQHS